MDCFVIKKDRKSKFDAKSFELKLNFIFKICWNFSRVTPDPDLALTLIVCLNSH